MTLETLIHQTNLLERLMEAERTLRGIAIELTFVPIDPEKFPAKEIDQMEERLKEIRQHVWNARARTMVVLSSQINREE